MNIVTTNMFCIKVLLTFSHKYNSSGASLRNLEIFSFVKTCDFFGRYPKLLFFKNVVNLLYRLISMLLCVLIVHFSMEYVAHKLGGAYFVFNCSKYAKSMSSRKEFNFFCLSHFLNVLYAVVYNFFDLLGIKFGDTEFAASFRNSFSELLIFGKFKFYFLINEIQASLSL